MGIIAVMAMGVYFTVNSASTQKSDLLSQNIEALSAGESVQSTFKIVKMSQSNNHLDCKKVGNLCCYVASGK